MEKKIYQDVVDALKSISAEELVAHGIINRAKNFNPNTQQGYVCPLCGSGTGQNHKHGDGDGAGTFDADNMFYCHACNNTANNGHKLSTIDLFMLARNISDFRSACLDMAAEFNISNISFPPPPPAPKKSADDKFDAAQINFIQSDISEAQQQLDALPADQRRGLTLDTLRHFGCGYLPQWIAPKIRAAQKVGIYNGNPPPTTRRIIIPTADNAHYNAVTLPADRQRAGKQHWKMHAGQISLFAANALTTGAGIVICVEGEIDAMSIWQATAGFIAVVAVIGGNARYLLDALKEQNITHKQFVILFDNDTGGQNNAQTLRGKLIASHYPAVNRIFDNFLSDSDRTTCADGNGKIDPNQILQARGEQFLSDLVQQIIDDAAADLASVADDISRADDTLVDKLKDKLKAAKKALADFETQKDRQLETIRNLDKFDSATMFNHDMINAAAYAYQFDKATFSSLRRDVKQYGDKHADQKVAVNDWLAELKAVAAQVGDNYSALKADLVAARAAADNKDFADKNNLQAIVPGGYICTAAGIEKISGDKLILVCRRPVIIAEQVLDRDTNCRKLVLSYKGDRRWQKIHAAEASTIFDRRKLVSLADAGLPVTSGNAAMLVDYLDAYYHANILPRVDTVARCGWHDIADQRLFVDPRRLTAIKDDDNRPIKITVDDRSQFARTLVTKGDYQSWYNDAYLVAKTSPIARFVGAASVAPMLLHVLSERNFLVHVYGRTTSGKTTALLYGASFVGSDKMLRSFDATRNGLLGAAADVNDYAFLIDEKQVADNHLDAARTNLVYALANGLGRTKLNKDSTLKPMPDWRVIGITTGETPLIPDNATQGAYTRSLQIPVGSAAILPADDCRRIRDCIKHNYGHVYPRVIDTVITFGDDNLIQVYRKLVADLRKCHDSLLADHCRFVAVVALADALIDIVVTGKEPTLDNLRGAIIDSVVDMAEPILGLLPTQADLSDITRAIDILTGFVAENQNCFVNGNGYYTNPDDSKKNRIYGKFDRDYTYITVAAVRDCCRLAGIDYRELVADLCSNGYFRPSDRLVTGGKTPRKTVKERILSVPTECYRIPADRLNVGNIIEPPPAK